MLQLRQELKIKLNCEKEKRQVFGIFCEKILSIFENLINADAAVMVRC
jgi:hypothetical protein